MTKFEETINEMKSHIADLDATLNAKADAMDEETKAKAVAAVEKTKAAINNSIEKVTAVIDDIKDDEKLNDFLDKVKAKSMEAVEYTKEKIEKYEHEEPKISIDDLHDEIMSEFDKIKESDTVKKAADFLKDIDTKINDFFEKPEVKSAINKAKVTTVNIAEKGFEGLKKVLDVEKKEENTEEVKPEEAAEEPKE